jgi:hypothetical protein
MARFEARLHDGLCRRVGLCLRTLTIVALTGLLATLPARAQIEPAAAEALMKRSGLWDALGALAPQVKAGMAQAMSQSPRPPSAEALERTGRVVDQAFAPEPLRRTALAAIVESLAPQHLPALNAWLDSERGQRVTAIEVAAMRQPPPPDPQQAMREAAALYQAASVERRALIDEHVRVTKAADLAHEAMVVTALAVARGVAAANPELPRPSLNELEGFLRAQKAQAMPTMGMVMTLSSARTYEALADADLKPYVEFLKTEPALAFNAVASQAMIRAIEAAGEEMGRNLRSAGDSGRS